MTEAINSTQRLRTIFEQNPEQLHFTLPRIVVQMLLQDSEMLGQERLARPRAAVGEQSREAIARIIDPDAFATYPFDPDRCEDFIAAIEQAAEDALAKADDILALQSQPAEVEGA